MRKITYKSRAIEAVILILGLILILTVWPMRIWQTKQHLPVAES